MSHPHAHEPRAAVEVAVVVVSDTRSLADDVGGRTIADLVRAAGHTVAAREVVPDEIAAIQAAVRRLVAAGVPVVVLTGGTGLSPRDQTPEAVEPLFSRRIEGFGELFRSLSFQEIGAAALLSRATAGVVGASAVFAVPGSPAACTLALTRLVLPELTHLVQQLAGSAPGRPSALGAAAPAPAPAPAPVEVPASGASPEPPAVPTGPVSVSTLTPAGGPTDEGSALGWRQALAALGAVVDTSRREPAPEALERIAPAWDVLQRAGQLAACTFPDGRRFALWGFPDLQRPGSKVLATRDAEPVPEVVALHRWPALAGTCVAGPSLVGGYGEDAAAVCLRVTGRAPSVAGEVLAVDRQSVWLRVGSRVSRWDGAKAHDEGTLGSALGRLVLGWSNR